MGWLFQPDPIDRDYIEQRIVPNDAELVDYSKQGAKHWLLIEAHSSPGDSLQRDFEPDSDGKVRFIALVLTQVDRASHCQYGYKAIDETMRPAEEACPLRLVKAASPLRRDPYTWRDRVLAHHVARRKARKPKLIDGQLIEFDQPIRFVDGEEHSRFIVCYYKPPFAKRTRLLFKTPCTGQLYRISNIASRSYRVIAEPAPEAA